MRATFLLPEYNCRKCTAQMQKIRNCHKESDTVVRMGDESFRRCPLIFARDNPRALAQIQGMWRMMEKGFLPEPGGTDDQQNQIMEALAIYDNAITSVKSDMRKQR